MEEYEVAYAGQASFLRPSGRRGALVPIATFETPSGSTYKLKAGVIHQVAITERPCITVVHTLERRIPIFSYGSDNEAAFDRRLCTDEEAATLKRHLSET